MTEEQPPAKKVVKRVVKKAVVRPAAAGAAPAQVRYGRPVTGTATKPKAKVTAPAKATPTSAPRGPARPRVQIGTKAKGAGKAISSRGSSAASGVAGAARSASRGVGSSVGRSARAVRAWRIPHWDPLPASIFTGALVGLISVGLGFAANAFFAEVRGVSAGGGRWGSLTFVVVAFIAFALGELLLSAFGVTQARLTSFLGIVLTIVAILGLFLRQADSSWALILVPAVGAVAYAVAHWLLDLAESSPRLPE